MIPKLKSHPITKWLNKNGWSYHKHQIDTLEQATKGYDILLAVSYTHLTLTTICSV